MKLLFKLTLTAIFLLNSLTLSSQNKEEQLRKKIENSKDSVLIKAYLDLGKYYYFNTGKGDSLIVYGTKALNLSKGLNYKEKQLESIKYIGTGYFADKDYDKAIKSFNSGLEFAEKLKKIDIIADFHVRLGAAFQNKGKNETAIWHMVKSANYAQQIKNYKIEANSYYGISVIYAEEEQTKKQLEYIQKALKIIEDHNIGDSYLETIIYTDASETYLELFSENSNNDYQKQFLDYSEKAMAIANQNSFEGRKVVLYSILGIYHNHTKDFKKAEFYAKEIINSKTRITDASLINAYTLLVKVHTVQNQKRLAYRYIDSLNTLKLKSSFGEGISNSSYLTYKHFKDTDLALKSLEEYAKFSKELYNISKTKALNELEIKYKTELKDAEIENLNQKQQIDALEIKDKQSQIKKLVVYLIIALSSIVLILFLGSRIQLKKTKQKNHELKLAFDKQVLLEKQITKVRDNIAQDFHDDLGNKLARLSFLSKMIYGDPSFTNEKVKLKVKQITNDANDLYTGTRDFIFSLKENSDCLDEVVTYLSDFGEGFFNKSGIKFILVKNIASNTTLPYYWSKQLVYIFKEAMTNALKHAKCNKVTLNFEYHDNKLCITCTDNGVGFTNKKKLTNGMLNMYKRAERIGGELRIVSEIEKGTTVKFIGNTNSHLKSL